MTTASRQSRARRYLHRARWLCVVVTAGYVLATVAPVDAAEGVPGQAPGATGTSSTGPLNSLSIGDQVSVQVYGKPELSTTAYVSDDGTLSIPLVGSVPVAGLSPAKAAQQIADAFSRGKYLVNPQVTVSPVMLRGPQVSVLGAVRTPGRFPIEPKTTVLDVLAMGGGVDDKGGDVVVLLRPDKDGKVTRSYIDLKGLSQANTPLLALTLRGGDSLFVPPAEQFFLNGEVRVPNTYRLQPGMTVVQAIALAGGVTRSGSNSRIEIKRRQPDGTYVTIQGNPNDTIQANDIIRIKESFF